MARRPAFIVQNSADYHSPLVEVVMVEFQWFPGMAKVQKQRSVEAMHSVIRKSKNRRTLEISSKSDEDLGVKLSAFNLGFTHPKSKAFITVESAFQGSKVFELSGPFPELYCRPENEAKQFFKGKELGDLTRFDFFGQHWPLEPMTMFYDWLYINTLIRNPPIAQKILDYNCFTDIEFNPAKSINCQAYSAALFVSLASRNLLDRVLESRDEYMRLIMESSSWIRSTEYAKYHTNKQIRFFD